MPVILALGKVRQKDHEFKASLGKKKESSQREGDSFV
jgi:hypothetical protein